MRDSIKNVLTIGDGIAAWCLHDELVKNTSMKITNISSSNLFKPCSLNSTSLNCLRGTTRGVSQLGDQIVDSYDLFEDFYKREKPDGVYRGHEYQLWKDDKSGKWNRRYPNSFNSLENNFLNKLTPSKYNYVKNEAYFINPNKLKSWYRQKNKAVTYLTGFVDEIKKDVKGYNVCSKNVDECFDAIFLCTNHATHLLGRGYSEEFDYYLQHSKPVAGTYLEIPISEKIYNYNFNIAIGSNHFIYKSDSNILQIGSTLDNRVEIDLANKSGVEVIYNQLRKAINYEFPPIEEFSLKTGIRHKGFERKPFWGKISDTNQIYSICGLYKNAFSLSYLAAKDIAESINLQ